GGNLDRDLAVLRHASRAAAGLARIADRLSGAAALRARTRDGEEALLRAHLARAAAEVARRRRRAGRCAGSTAGLAVFLARNLNRGLGAFRRFLERDLEVVTEVGAALRTAAAASAAEEIAEPEDVAEAAEDVLETGEDVRIEPPRAGRARDARVSEAVVCGALVGVREDRVRLRALLESLFRLVIAGIAVRVVLQRKLSVRALDLAVTRRALDREDLVVIAFVGRS